jgi:uncharacterized protein YkwD
VARQSSSVASTVLVGGAVVLALVSIAAGQIFGDSREAGVAPDGAVASERASALTPTASPSPLSLTATSTVALPLAAQGPPLHGGYANEVLSLVNDLRSQGGDCGPEGKFAPSPALSLNTELTTTAQLHAESQARQGVVGHQITGQDGSSPAERIERQGYRWLAYGENVAGGQGSPQEVVAAWASSPGHCRNLLSPDFVHMGIGQARDAQGRIYWAQTFGRPR